MVHDSNILGCQDNQIYCDKTQPSYSDLNPVPSDNFNHNYNHKRNSHLRSILSNVPVQSLLFECECCNAQVEDLEQLHRHVMKHKFEIIFRKMSALPPEKAAKIFESILYRNNLNRDSLSKHDDDGMIRQNWQRYTQRPSDQELLIAKAQSQVTEISSNSFNVSKTTDDNNCPFSSAPSSTSHLGPTSTVGPTSALAVVVPVPPTATTSTEYDIPAHTSTHSEYSRFNLLRSLLDNVNYGTGNRTETRKRTADDSLNNMEEYQQPAKRVVAVITCEVCNESFTNPRDLVSHQLFVHKLQTSQGCRWCAKCGQKFLTVAQLYVHETRECL